MPISRFMTNDKQFTFDTYEEADLYERLLENPKYKLKFSVSTDKFKSVIDEHGLLKLSIWSTTSYSSFPSDHTTTNIYQGRLIDVILEIIDRGNSAQNLREISIKKVQVNRETESK